MDAKLKREKGFLGGIYKGGRTNTEMDVIEWCKTLSKWEPRKYSLTSMDADGGKCGYDIGLTSKVAKR